MIEGRILKGVGGLYFVLTAQGLYTCKPRGIFRKDNQSPLVGDIVKISIQDEKDKEGTIEKINPRKNEMLRPRVTNIDISILVFATENPPISLEFLDKLIVMSEEQNLKIIICINKSDLSNDEKFLKIKSLYESIGYPVLFISSFKEDETKKEILNHINKGTILFSGPSGVGKSSIANLFLINNHMETGEISKKLGRGKHTTRHSEIFEVKENTFIVDSPGFTSITLPKMEKLDLQKYFREFKPFIGRCKFSNCLHLNEPGCIILDEVGKSISKIRYDRYVSFLNEIDKRRK